MEAIVGVGGDKEATTFVRLEVQTDDEIVHAAILIEHDQWNGSNWLWLYGEFAKWSGFFASLQNNGTLRAYFQYLLASPVVGFAGHRGGVRRGRGTKTHLKDEDF